MSRHPNAGGHPLKLYSLQDSHIRLRSYRGHAIVFRCLESQTMSSAGVIISRRALFAVPTTLLAHRLCRAQDLGDVWVEWEIQTADKREPPLANGLLLHFEHDEGSNPVRKPIALVFAEIARMARWNVLRIGKRAGVADEHVMRLAANQIDRARAAGCRQIIVAGIRRGGRLALLAARLSDVDAAIALAPDVATVYELHDLLADSRAGARAQRIVAFFSKKTSQNTSRNAQRLPSNVSCNRLARPS